MEISLEKLLFDSRKLASNATISDIPIVERNILSLDSDSRNLVSKASRNLGPSEKNAKSFLLDGGIDTKELLDRTNSALFDPAYISNRPVLNSNVDVNSLHFTFILHA
ncbi:hypothetical protein AYI69_g4183 [Smittium culicis]|uniref:Uncharacterized protein n=1 Tax=Smittium culicis TaxID=133412 RepID=A0A1R1YG45_9FUNG|nr:hypothetical protein AYI69_g4183 [Smittium culicis]